MYSVSFLSKKPLSSGGFKMLAGAGGAPSNGAGLPAVAFLTDEALVKLVA
ncbi:MAG: hypothetical protein HY973_02550 [Candidatus Kerfeldbacteria bacterium]|nr:hypothetical protein [Candidatus Kerfeldbacteria bacterium]